MAAYYNEHDAFAAAWLRNLIQAGLIPEGDVDERSIVNVRADDLRAYRQCHFFAGIGGWSHALRLAGWSDDREIWTGSCPCQPFSVAGKGKGKSDERHLWPVFFDLIRQVRPTVVMGEQVAGKAGYGWFDGVSADLEREGYASRAVDIPACAVNAPHIRQRLYWVAVDNTMRGRHGDAEKEICARRLGVEFSGRDDGSAVGDADAMRQLQPQGFIGQQRGWVGNASGGDMGYANGSRSASRVSAPTRRSEGLSEITDNGSCGQSGPWEECEWLTGQDGKTRRAKPGVRLLVDGVPNRVGRLRGYGNAIVPPLAAEVIKTFMEVAP